MIIPADGDADPVYSALASIDLLHQLGSSGIHSPSERPADIDQDGSGFLGA